MLHSLLAAFIALHGLIHLLGFAKGFHLAEVAQLKQPISKPMGLLWLLATLGCLTAALLLLLLPQQSVWLGAVAAAALSQVLIATAWKDAKWGSIANAIVLALALVDGLNGAF